LKPSLNNASGTTTRLRGVWGIITLDFEQSYKWFEHHTLTQNLKVQFMCPFTCKVLLPPFGVGLGFE